MKLRLIGMTTVLLAATPVPDRATIAAGLLAQADRAASGSSQAGRRELSKTVAALDRLGVRADPAGPAEGGPALANWRSRAGGAEPPMRGRVLGPAFRRGWLDAGGALKVDQLFLAGQTASVAVAGAPGEGVNLAVEGPGAPPACIGSNRSCRWTPIFTQRYTITVRNAGKAGTRYYLVMD